MNRWIASLGIFLFFISGCEKRPVAPAATQGMVIATINDHQIIDKDFLIIMDLIKERTPIKPETHPQKKELLDQLINIELLYEEALQKKFQDRLEFKIKLADVYIEDLMRQARETLKDQDIKDEYRRHPEEYDQVSAKHIFFSLPEGRSAPEKVREDKLQLANRVLEEVRRSPDQFSILVRQHTEDRNSRQGGELGFFTRKQMDKSVADAAFALKKIGDISTVVRSSYGYHLLQLTGDQRGFDLHKEAIRTLLTQKRMKSIIKDELAKLRKNKKIQIYEENLAKLSPLPGVIQPETIKK